MDNMNIGTTSSQGWGADEALEKRPGVPKEGDSTGKSGAHWVKPEQQIPTVKIFKTIERNEITPVFGTTCPPRGLSGVIRTVAYRYSENRLRHWMMLLMADRIDVIEGMIEDVFQGKLPHLIKEMGLKSELKNRQGIHRLSKTRAAGGPPTRGLVVAGVIAVGVAAYFLTRSKKPSLPTEFAVR